MSGFSESSLALKLGELNASAPSIQGVSLWLIHHRKHYQTSVKVWYKELGNTKNDRKLTMLYLANDVVQNAKKKYPEIPKEFGKVMKAVFCHLAALDLGQKTEGSLERLLKIWRERQIFEKQVMIDVEKVWVNRASRRAGKTRSRAPSSSPPASKKERTRSPKSSSSPTKEALAELFDSEEQPTDHNSNCDINGKSSPSSTPESEDLIAALQHLEASASSDACVRERIAKLPPELADVGSLEKICSVDEAREQLVQLDAASSLLMDYNNRLQEELRDRTKVGKMIADFLTSQQDILAQTEERLEMYRDKLDKVNQVRKELEAHLASLPDIPPPTKESDTLPSTTDLFTA